MKKCCKRQTKQCVEFWIRPIDAFEKNTFILCDIKSSRTLDKHILLYRLVLSISIFPGALSFHNVRYLECQKLLPQCLTPP